MHWHFKGLNWTIVMPVGFSVSSSGLKALTSRRCSWASSCPSNWPWAMWPSASCTRTSITCLTWADQRRCAHAALSPVLPRATRSLRGPLTPPLLPWKERGRGVGERAPSRGKRLKYCHWNQRAGRCVVYGWIHLFIHIFVQWLTHSFEMTDSPPFK